MCGINLILLLLLLIFYDILLSYSLALIQIITTTGIPVRRNTLSTRTKRSQVRQHNSRQE